MHRHCLAVLFPLLATLAAQPTVDTVGGTTVRSTRANAGKANLFRVDRSIVLTNFEMYLDVPGPETLVWFLYRHHSQNGTYTLEWTMPVNVNGTGMGALWYSPGPMALPLLAGNHYMIGAAWTGTPAYFYMTASSGQQVSFGAWIRAVTPLPGNALPATWNISGLDAAQYYQRLTSVPLAGVTRVGASCSARPTPPRLVASRLPAIGSSFSLDLVDALGGAPALHLLAVGPTLPVPIPLFGCSLWVNPGGVVSVGSTTTSAGVSSLSVPVPNDPGLRNLPVAAQALYVNPPNVDFTHALQLTIL
jgi:hypothetical protein